ncbi:hypothetical protein EK21DRAFT_65248 [Setomelanomma holmii]|uniref:Uncharacterized protein n=1 Tax=Setomelanomma holmii TaxID=210430 RepID=A0A9P4LP41_9PLEO|nr:hypothetical protein EK21DRAFT_65248 [Setomelanomma holmii]
MPFRFLDLPAELRNYIYKYLAIVGTVFYTPDWFEYEEGARFKEFRHFDKPSLQILQTCKQNYAEVEPLYLAGNMFALPSMFEFHEPLELGEPFVSDLKLPLVKHAHEDRILFSNMALTSVRNFSLAVCVRREIPITATHTDWSDRYQNCGGHFTDLLPQVRMREAHFLALRCQRTAWNRQTGSIKGFTSPPDRLEIDMTNSYCPFGCCRNCPDGFFLFLSDLKPKEITLVGLYENEITECRWQIETFVRLLSCLFGTVVEICRRLQPLFLVVSCALLQPSPQLSFPSPSLFLP